MNVPCEKKLLEIYKCIEDTCNSSVKIFDKKRGHTNRSVGYAAYEERQQKLLELSNQRPDVIAYLCKKGGRHYFKFEGRTIKIVSSARENLAPNVFEKNMIERDEELQINDPLWRIIYKTDYDLQSNEAHVIECYFIEIDRNSGEVIESSEINILKLAKQNEVLLEEIDDKQPDEVELLPSSLVPKKKGNKQSKTANDNDTDKA